MPEIKGFRIINPAVRHCSLRTEVILKPCKPASVGETRTNPPRPCCPVASVAPIAVPRRPVEIVPIRALLLSPCPEPFKVLPRVTVPVACCRWKHAPETREIVTACDKDEIPEIAAHEADVQFIEVIVTLMQVGHIRDGMAGVVYCLDAGARADQVH